MKYDYKISSLDIGVEILWAESYTWKEELVCKEDDGFKFQHDQYEWGIQKWPAEDSEVEGEITGASDSKGDWKLIHLHGLQSRES